MRYKVVVKNFNSGLNELLLAQEKKYDSRIKRYRVWNSEKTKNDRTCKAFLIKAGLHKIKLKTPILLHYHIFAKDKKHDRMNIATAFDKSFEDALQEIKAISNDGWDDVMGATFEFDIDKNNPRIEVVIEELEDI